MMTSLPSSVDQFRYLGVCLGALVCVVGTIGNLMTIVAYSTNPRMRTAFNLLIVNLAVIDLVISAVIMPVLVSSFAKAAWPFSETSCEVFAYFYYAIRYTSAVNLLTISFNRFMHVTRPHTAYRIMFSTKRRRLAGLFVWIFAPLCLLPLIFTGGFGWRAQRLMCTFTRKEGFPNIYSLTLRILFQLVPFLGMVLLYSVIFRTVKKTHANVDNPKIKVESCESDFYSNVTRTQNGTSPSRSPSTTGRISPSSYQLRLSRSPSTTTKPMRSLTETPSSDKVLAWRKSSKESQRSSPCPIPEEGLWMSAGATPATLAVVVSTEDSPRILRVATGLPNHVALDSPSISKSSLVRGRRRSNSDDDGVYRLSVLRRKSISMRHAKLCRSATVDNIVTSGAESANTNSNGSSEHRAKPLSACKSRSVTFSCVSLVHHSNSHCSSIKLKNEESETTDEQSKSELLGSGDLLQRPRRLSLGVPLHSQVGVQEESGRNRSATLTIPKTKRTSSISIASLSPTKIRDRLSSVGSFMRSEKCSIKRRTSVQHVKAQRQLLYMSIVICATFALCALPSLILNLVSNYTNIGPEFYMASSNLAWLTSMINPIVYAAMNAQFRKEYSRVMEKVAKLITRKSKNIQPLPKSKTRSQTQVRCSSG